MSTPPNAFTAASTIFWQFSSEFGRRVMLAVFAPNASPSAAAFFNSSGLLAAGATLAPAPASALAASAPKAPEAPVTIAVLPRISKRERGFFRKDSDMGASSHAELICSSSRGIAIRRTAFFQKPMSRPSRLGRHCVPKQGHRDKPGDD